MKTETLHVTETEERILNAALKVVNDVTISGTRMHLIAEKADMVQSNVHYYYKTKQELLKGLQEWILEECYDMQQVSKKSRIDADIRARFQEAYAVWRDNIREIIIRFCPNMDETDKELIPYMAVSLLEGASIQVLVDGKGFDADSYFAYAEDMVLQQIRIAMEKKEG